LSSIEEPARGTQAYCTACNTYFRNAKGAMKHILANDRHAVHYVDALDPKSREANIVLGLPEKVLQMIYNEQLKASKKG
jgi:hypothetical protein